MTWQALILSCGAFALVAICFYVLTKSEKH
jgi:hypothetical protein